MNWLATVQAHSSGCPQRRPTAGLFWRIVQHSLLYTGMFDAAASWVGFPIGRRAFGSVGCLGVYRPVQSDGATMASHWRQHRFNHDRPPGGASALTAVIGSDAIHTAGFGFALLPVGINSVTLVMVGLLFHRLTSHSYPHRPLPAPDAGLHLADIDAALEDMHEIFDISREDLDALLSRAEMHAAKRKAT